MRRFGSVLWLFVVVTPMWGQVRIFPGTARAANAEAIVKQAAEQLGNEKKGFDRDLETLRHLRTADAALIDAMQPAVSLQKAYEEVDAASGLSTDFRVQDGIIRMRQALEEARRSPAAADFGRLRVRLLDDALAPASRVAIRNATKLEEEVLAWLKVQQAIADHLRVLADITSESLIAAER